MQAGGKKVWFRVKRHGYGVGLPVAWEGWLVLALYLAAVAVSAVLFSEWASLAVLAVLTPVVIYRVYLRSDDEWRWRNGD